MSCLDQRPRSAGELPITTVDVWWFRGGRVSSFPLLDRMELDQMHRLRTERDRRRFGARRTLLRRVVAEYTAEHPAALQFDRSCECCGDPQHGRPRLDPSSNISFSTAGRLDVVTIAVSASSMRVGIDIERVDPASAADVFEVGLTDSERAGVDRSDAAAILQLWCRKEALLKARGLGLAVVAPDELDVRNRLAGGWYLTDVPAPAGWVVALATREEPSEVVVVDGDTDAWSMDAFGTSA
jgi:4'-phosphopantetheinyl transferase